MEPEITALIIRLLPIAGVLLGIIVAMIGVTLQRRLLTCLGSLLLFAGFIGVVDAYADALETGRLPTATSFTLIGSVKTSYGEAVVLEGERGGDVNIFCVLYETPFTVKSGADFGAEEIHRMLKLPHATIHITKDGQNK